MLTQIIPKRWLYFARTIAKLRPIQLRYQLLRRLRGKTSAPRPDSLGLARSDLETPRFLPRLTTARNSNQIVFLNVERPLPDDNVDWAPDGTSKLWRYNLHYFEFLHWDCYPRRKKEALITDWVQNNPFGKGDGWEPYTCSSRIINWVKFYLEIGPDALPASVERSLATQLLWLEKNLEFHLLGNHLLKNAAALVLGGAFFDSNAAARCLQRGTSLLLSQAREQFLSDGGHFERSPQYHSLCLEDCLEVIALLKNNPSLVDEAALHELCKIASAAATYLSTILAADHQIPLFNDSAFRIASEPRDLLSYAANVLGINDKSPHIASTRIFLPDSGYFGYRSAGDSMVIDCGPIGPDYQPGHAHCDTLSYELCIDEKRVVVDSGVFDYEAGEMRNYVRSTRAHNTVAIDHEEQSEIWSAFRVARRAYPVSASLSAWHEQEMVFRGAHDGYRRIPGKVIHERKIILGLAGVWRVEDRLLGRGNHLAESFINFHPDVVVRQSRQREFQLLIGDSVIASLIVLEPCDIRQETGWYCPEFGVRQTKSVLVLSSTGSLPTTLSYEIRKIS